MYFNFHCCCGLNNVLLYTFSVPWPSLGAVYKKGLLIVLEGGWSNFLSDNWYCRLYQQWSCHFYHPIILPALLLTIFITCYSVKQCKVFPSKSLNWNRKKLGIFEILNPFFPLYPPHQSLLGRRMKSARGIQICIPWGYLYQNLTNIFEYTNVTLWSVSLSWNPPFFYIRPINPYWAGG